MADGDTVITIKLKLDEGDAESSAATAGKDAGEAFRKAFEDATKGLDVSKSLKSDDLKKTFSQIGDEGKKTAKDLQDAFAKVQMPAAAAAGAPAGVPGAALAVPRMRYRPPEEDRRQEEQIHRHIENVSKGIEAFSSLLRGASLVEVARTAGPVFSALLAGRGGIAAGGRAAARAVSAEEVAGGGRAEEVLAGGIGAAVGGGVRGATGGGIAARFAGGAVGELMGGPVGAAIGTLAAGFIGSKIIDTITETSKALEEMGEKGSKTAIRMNLMAREMGISQTQFQKMRYEAAKTGIDFEDFARVNTRLAISMTREWPEIEKRVADSSNVMTEANIKVGESERGVTLARLARGDASDQVIKAETALEQTEATGQARRDVQLQQAQLGVSGAAIGVRGAQMRALGAGIQLQFAPQEQALQNVEGPLTVENAEMGLRGASLGSWAAGLRLRQARGETISPDEQQQLQMAQVSHAASAARLQKKNAEEALRRARLEEGKRVTTETAGLGPVGQAGQQFLEAGQAVKQAEAQQQVQQMTLQNLQIQRKNLTFEREEQEKRREVEKARLGEQQKRDDEEKARIGKERAMVEAQDVQFKDIPNVVAAMRGQRPDILAQMERVPPGVLRDALMLRAQTEFGGGIGGATRALEQFLQGPLGGEKGDLARQEAAVQAVFQSRPGETRNLTRLYAKPQERRTPEENVLLTRAEKLVTGMLPGSEEFEQQKGREQFFKDLDELSTQAVDLRTGVAADALGVNARLARINQIAQRLGINVLGEVTRKREPKAEPTIRAVPPRQRQAPGAAGRPFIRRPGEVIPLDIDPELLQEEAPSSAPPPSPQSLLRTQQIPSPTVDGAVVRPVPVLPLGTQPSSAIPVTVTNAKELQTPPGVPPTPGGVATTVTVAGGNINVTGTVTVANCPCPQGQTGGGGGITATEQARGGLIRGPGTGTSDSIPILASNGEYIIRQSRVAQLGVPFLDALNNRRVRFNLGGLVSLQHGGRVDSPSSLQSYDEASVQRALYKAWTDAHGTTPDPDSWAQVMRAKLNPETALDRYGNITEEGKKQAEQKRQGLAASLPPELTDQSFWERLARTGRTKIDPGDPKSALAVASPGYMNELRRQMGLPPLLIPGVTADPQAQNAAAEAQRAQLLKVEQSIADQLRTDVWSRLAMTGSTMISPGDPHSAGIVASPRFLKQLRDSLGIKIPVDQDMSVDAQLARTGVAWGGTTYSIKIVASPLYQNILRERFGLPRLPGPGLGPGPGARPPQAPTVLPPGALPGTAVPLAPRVPPGTPYTPSAPSGAPYTSGVPSGRPPMTQNKAGIPAVSDKYLDDLQRNPGYIPQGPWQLYDTDTQKYIDMQPGKLLPVEPPAQTMWTIPTGPNGMFLTHDGVPAYRPPDNGMSLDYLQTDKGKALIPQGPWKVWDASRSIFIDMKPGSLQPVDPKAVMTPAPTPVPAVPVPDPGKPAAPLLQPDPNQPVLPTIKPSTAPEPPPPEPSQPTQPPGITTPLPRPRPAEAPPPVLPGITIPLPRPRPAEALPPTSPPTPPIPPPTPPSVPLPTAPAVPTPSTEDMLKDLRENVIPSMIPLPKPAPGRLGRPEEEEIPKDLPPSDLMEAPSRQGEAERKVREASINGGDDEGAWRGGLIRLSGGGLVPAMVSNGEYRMSPEAVSHYGVSLFDRLNGGGFAGGGSITMGQAQPPRPAGFPSGFSPIPEPGLIGEIANAMRNIGGVDPGVIRTITGVASGAGEVASTHRLDLVTSAGTFTVQAGAETLAAIQSSAIGGKLTSTGARPSWY